MQKPKSLRAQLEKFIPELRNEPERLALWVEDGAVRCHATEGQGFSFEYPLSVLLTEINTDIAIITLAITRWLRVNQPDLLTPQKRFRFESDILDSGTADLQFTLPLTEAVRVTPNEDGSAAIEYVAEPDPLFDDGEPFEGVDPPVALAEVQTVGSIVAD